MRSEKTSTARASSTAIEGGARPLLCPRCSWLGMKDQTDEASACPQCHGKVNPLRQKGLDSLRTRYRRLSKMGYSFAISLADRDAEQERLEKFFQRIGAPL